MNYLESLIALDSGELAREAKSASLQAKPLAAPSRVTQRTVAPPPSSATKIAADKPAAPEIDPRETIELLLCTLENLCVPLLVTTSLLNQSTRMGDARAVGAGLLNYANLNVEPLHIVARELIGDRQYLRAATLITELQTRLNLARGMTETFVTQSNTSTVGALPGNDIVIRADTLADAWCRTCKTGADVIRMALHFSELGPPDNERLLKTMAWLLKAADGAAPCFNGDGEMYVPGWAERRASQRVVVNKPIAIRVRGHRVECTLYDVSETGFQIRNVRGLMKGEEVVVMLSPTNHVAAHVVWTKDDASGLETYDRLSPNDPIFS